MKKLSLFLFGIILSIGLVAQIPGNPNANGTITAGPPFEATGITTGGGEMQLQLQYIQSSVDSMETALITDSIATNAINYADTYYDDMLGPLVAAKMDISSGRIDYNYFNGAVAFQANARYPEEPAGIRMQIPHKWKPGTYTHPHIHWKQQSATKPNWLFAYKISENGEADIIETDYSNYTLDTIRNDVFTYSSGVLNQISEFDSIDMTGVGISDVFHVILFRDNDNTSGLFSGASPSIIVEYATDLDLHIEINEPGSANEYSK